MSRLYTEADVFCDESGSVWVGKVFTVAGFEKWLAEQKLTRRLLYVVDHHTWSPADEPSSPLSFCNRVQGIGTNYYWKKKSDGGRGWTWGYMPQLWLAVIKGEPYVTVGTHPSWAAPQCTHFNKEGLGIETWWNGDRERWTHPIHYGLWRIHKALEAWAGIPLTRAVTGPTNTNMPSGKKGWLFHRDARDSNKSCPGWKNDHDDLLSAWREYEKEDDVTPDEVRKIIREEMEIVWSDTVDRDQAYLVEQEIISAPRAKGKAASVSYVDSLLARVLKKAVGETPDPR